MLFRSDGNGRIARLVKTYELLRHGYGVARYASLEQRICESKNSYYEALRASQRNWHDGEDDVWPWMLYLVRIVDDAYADFEARIVAARELTGTTKIEQSGTTCSSRRGKSFVSSTSSSRCPTSARRPGGAEASIQASL